MNIQLYQFEYIQEFTILKNDLKELWDLYSHTSMNNKSFEKINTLYLSIQTYFWAIDRKRPNDLKGDDLNFWLINEIISRYILKNTDITKLRNIVYLSKYRERISDLVERIMTNFELLRQKYPLHQDQNLCSLQKFFINSVDDYWKKD